jgi:hypothetical protein
MRDPIRRFVTIIGLVGLAALARLPGAAAHEGEAHAPPAGDVIEASAIVDGRVAELKGLLYQVERWPEVFSDVRAVAPRADGPWSVDFRRFAHPHDFRVFRTAGGVALELAQEDHGGARLEYRLQPIDAARSQLTVRLSMTTPPGMTAAQAAALLRAKADADVADFARVAAARQGPVTAAPAARR